MDAKAVESLATFCSGRAIAGLAAAVLLGLTSGCGGGKVAVSGEVRVNGQSLDEGTISFRPADGAGPSLGGAITMGRYDIALAAPNAAGKKLVSITGIRRTGRRIPAGPPEPPGTTVEEILVVEFGQKGELTCELSLGSNREDFDLKSP